MKISWDAWIRQQGIIYDNKMWIIERKVNSQEFKQSNLLNVLNG